METVARWMAGKLETWRGLLRRIAPYLLLEILMPGGTLIALGLFLYRRRQAGQGLPIMGGIARLQLTRSAQRARLVLSGAPAAI